jgi:hypothetical protein
MTVSELKVSRDRGEIQPISRAIVSVDSPHFEVIAQQSIENMKMTAELRENETANRSLGLASA